MIVYIKNHKSSTRKLLQLINTFRKATGHTINTQIGKEKSVAFLYTNDKQTEKEIRETTPFPIASKYFPIALIKQGNISMMKT